MLRYIETVIALITHPRKTTRQLIETKDFNISGFIFLVVVVLFSSSNFRFPESPGVNEVLFTIAGELISVAVIVKIILLLTILLLKITQKLFDGQSSWVSLYHVAIWSLASIIPFTIFLEIVYWSNKLIINLWGTNLTINGTPLHIFYAWSIVLLLFLITASKIAYQIIMVAEANQYTLRKSIIHHLLALLPVGMAIYVLFSITT